MLDLTKRALNRVTDALCYGAKPLDLLEEINAAIRDAKKDADAEGTASQDLKEIANA